MVCKNCGGQVRVISVILEHKVTREILGHLAGKGIEAVRGPPPPGKTPPAKMS